MKNWLELLKKNAWKVSTVVLLLLYLAKGCTHSRVSDLEKQYAEDSQKTQLLLDSLRNVVSTKKEVRDEMERTMFNYLIYEDDLDKGKSSLSDVKNKIEAND
jgi:CII-binding regulator of phage lambda lysogenization HflD